MSSRALTCAADSSSSTPHTTAAVLGSHRHSHAVRLLFCFVKNKNCDTPALHMPCLRMFAALLLEGITSYLTHENEGSDWCQHLSNCL